MAISETQTVEVYQMNKHCCAATGKPTYDYKIQHHAYEKHQEHPVLIVAELSFPVHFVALPSLRFTYGNHTATLASITPPHFLRPNRPGGCSRTPGLQS
jgi:hypothetical protein